MGRLDKGRWIVEDIIPKARNGEFERQEQKFRNRIAPGETHPPEHHRYHLYVSYACPWAHRSLIMRKLKRLEDVISLSVVSPFMLDDGWTFEEDFEGVIPDPVLHKQFLRDVYVEADPMFSGRVTVPVLFDKKLSTIVNNESADVIRILNEAFQSSAGTADDFYPQALRPEIDHWNETIYDHVNNGVYKCGFATTQEAYDKNVFVLFETLEKVDRQLEGKMFLVGEQLTEADIRLYTTLVRFDPVYYLHFKCNRRPIREFPNLSRYLRHLYSLEAFRTTTRFDHIKAHYYVSQKQINPFQIVPAGPDVLVP